MWGRMLGRGGRSKRYDDGIKFFDQGLYEQAIKAFQAALTEPGSGPLLERLARFYLAESHSALALSQIQRSGGDGAIANLLEAIALNPRYADLYFHLGSAYLNQNSPKEAADALKRAVGINPKYARARLYLGVALYETGDRDAGLKEAGEALTLEPTLAARLLEEARDAHERGDFASVPRLLRKMAETDNDDAFFHARLALDLFRRGMHDEAASEYRQALAIKPGYADLRNQLGVTLYAGGRDDEAVTEFAQAVTINPKYVEAHLNHGLALARLGRIADARTAYETALALDPTNTVAQENLAALPAA